MINKGTEIVYVLFEDQTGVIISRMDGEWSGTLSGSINITGGLTTAGNVTAADMITPSVESLNSLEARIQHTRSWRSRSRIIANKWATIEVNNTWR